MGGGIHPSVHSGTARVAPGAPPAAAGAAAKQGGRCAGWAGAVQLSGHASGHCRASEGREGKGVRHKSRCTACTCWTAGATAAVQPPLHSTPGVLLLLGPLEDALTGRALRPPPELGVRKAAPAALGWPTTACSPLLPILLERLRSTTGRAWRRPPLMKPPGGRGGRRKGKAEHSCKQRDTAPAKTQLLRPLPTRLSSRPQGVLLQHAPRQYAPSHLRRSGGCPARRGRGRRLRRSRSSPPPRPPPGRSRRHTPAWGRCRCKGRCWDKCGTARQVRVSLAWEVMGPLPRQRLRPARPVCKPPACWPTDAPCTLHSQ